MSAVLEVRELVAGYGAAPVLRGIDLTIEPGSITTVLGANGAGKTTLLRTISGLVRPTSGTVTLQGKDIRRVPVERLVRLGLAHVPEGRGVVAELTVEENLRLGGLWQRDAHKTMNADLARVYERFEPLAARRRNPGHQLSGGERQMLALGRALMAKPRLLLLDEPSLGLAPRVTAQIMALLAQLRERTGLTVLLVEQNARSALSIADSAVVMALGRVVAATSAEQLRTAYLGR
jgi:branched-chain amino acid transport system ATP-binding protein